jgi:hypothetical protein
MNPDRSSQKQVICYHRVGSFGIKHLHLSRWESKARANRCKRTGLELFKIFQNNYLES